MRCALGTGVQTCALPISRQVEMPLRHEVHGTPLLLCTAMDGVSARMDTLIIGISFPSSPRTQSAIIPLASVASLLRHCERSEAIQSGLRALWIASLRSQ